MPKLLSFISKALSIGVHANMGTEEVFGATLSNAICFLGLSVSFILASLHSIFIGWDYSAKVTLIAGILFIIPLLLNYKRQFLLNRIFLSIYIPLAIISASVFAKVYQSATQAVIQNQYYDFRYLLVISGLASLGLYDRHNKKWMYLSFVYVALLLMAADPIHNFFGVGYFQVQHDESSYYFINVNILLSYTALVAGMLILRFAIDLKEEQLIGEIENRRITEIKMVNAKEQALAANEVKSEFLANMTHELRTPLNGIIGFSDLLSQTKLDSDQQRFLKPITESAKILLNTIDNILTIVDVESNASAINESVFDPREMAIAALETIKADAERKKLKVNLWIDPKTPPLILADQALLLKVLGNLLNNSVKFTKKGRIEVKVNFISSTTKNIEVLRFTVNDTGIGIDVNQQQNIFNAFIQGDLSSTKKFSGTGLGLAVSNKLLAQMNSKLILQKTSTQGTAFHFDIVLRSAN